MFRVCVARTISRLTGSVELDTLGIWVASVVHDLRAKALVLGQKSTTGRAGRVGLSAGAARGPFDNVLADLGALTEIRAS